MMPAQQAHGVDGAGDGQKPRQLSRGTGTMAAPRTGTSGWRYLSAMFAAAIFIARLDVGACFSSALGCPFELLACLGTDDCNECLNALQSAGLTVGDQDFEVCSDLYAGTCAAAAEVGCDTENAALVELLTCVAEDAFGCADFTTCSAFPVDEDDSSSSSSSSSDEGGVEAVTGSPSTLAPIAVTTPSPSFDGTAAPTASPSFGSHGGGSLSPTATPTGGDPSSYADTAYPSAAPTGLWSSMEGTAAPSASSLAPTPAADGLHGGYSGAPTAAPTTGVDGVDDRTDGVNGGTVSASFGGGFVVAVVGTASVVLGAVSPLAAAVFAV